MEYIYIYNHIAKVWPYGVCIHVFIHKKNPKNLKKILTKSPAPNA